MTCIHRVFISSKMDSLKNHHVSMNICVKIRSYVSRNDLSQKLDIIQPINFDEISLNS